MNLTDEQWASIKHYLRTDCQTNFEMALDALCTENGLVVVPREPTEGMIKAARCWPSSPSKRAIIQTYKWMLTAWENSHD